MLQSPTIEQSRALRLAERIEKMDRREFEMRTWHTCICGHLVRQECPDIGAPEFYSMTGADIMRLGERLLGLYPIDGARLFTAHEGAGPAEAARVLRHWVATGEVDWSAALGRPVHMIRWSEWASGATSGCAPAGLTTCTSGGGAGTAAVPRRARRASRPGAR